MICRVLLNWKWRSPTLLPKLEKACISCIFFFFNVLCNLAIKYSVYLSVEIYQLYFWGCRWFRNTAESIWFSHIGNVSTLANQSWSFQTGDLISRNFVRIPYPVFSISRRYFSVLLSRDSHYSLQYDINQHKKIQVEIRRGKQTTIVKSMAVLRGENKCYISWFSNIDRPWCGPCWTYLFRSCKTATVSVIMTKIIF